MAMTARDYEALAKGLRRARPVPLEGDLPDRGEAAGVVWESCVTQVALVLGAGNPRFDGVRFRLACGVGE